MSPARTYLPTSDSPFDTAYSAWLNGSLDADEYAAEDLNELTSCARYYLGMGAYADDPFLEAFVTEVEATIASKLDRINP